MTLKSNLSNDVLFHHHLNPHLITTETVPAVSAMRRSAQRTSPAQSSVAIKKSIK